MKLLVFAHKPPPLHGQSLMVELMVEGLGGGQRGRNPGPAAAAKVAGGADYGIRCYHVDARLSNDLEDVGTARWGKILRLLRYCTQAWICRWRHGVRTFYYVPSPPKRASLYRDWLVMLLCRPLYRRLVLAWHATGLGEWLETEARPWERRLSHRLLGQADLAIVLSEFNAADAARLRPRRMTVVANGIPDPCPDYERELGPRRAARAEARRRLLAGAEPEEELQRRAGADSERVRVLFLAHCTRSKGVFDALEGVALANTTLAQRRSPLRFELRVAGGYLDAAGRAEFEQALRQRGAEARARHLGFLVAGEKWGELRAADIFCFPTYYENESQPVNLIEAMAHGLPVVTTRWRSIPEFIPAEYTGLIEPRQPAAVAAALLAVLGEDGSRFRQVFTERFTLERHLAKLAAALQSTVQGAAERPD